MKGASEDELVAHCAAVAAQIPLVGFYLQPAVGGIALSAAFWRRFCEIENVIAVKVAPFNRYRTLDVAKGLVAARAEDRVTLYTGNDDHIVLDLLVPLAVQRGGQEVQVRIKGGLLGHWSVWTKSAVDLLEKIKNLKAIDAEILALDSKVTDANSAFFDVAHDFAGCIAGCHEVLRRQGLFEGIWCLDPKEGPFARAGRGDRPRLCRVSRDERRRLRPGESGKMAFIVLEDPMSETFPTLHAGDRGAPGAAAGLVPVRHARQRAAVRHALAGRRRWMRCCSRTTAGGPTSRVTATEIFVRLLPRAGGRRRARPRLHLVEGAGVLLHAAAGVAQHDPEGGAGSARSSSGSSTASSRTR